MLGQFVFGTKLNKIKLIEFELFIFYEVWLDQEGAGGWVNLFMWILKLNDPGIEKFA